MVDETTVSVAPCEHCGRAPKRPNRAVRRAAARRGVPVELVAEIDHAGWCPRCPVGYMPRAADGGRRG